MISIILQRFRRTGRAFSVLSVLILAMMLRGIVPAGYMPAFDTDRQGSSLLAFCSHGDSSGIPDALAALWADVDTGSEPDAISESCAFCVLTQLSMDLPETGELAVASGFLSSQPALFAKNPSLPQQGPRGPPLGSRAPPVFIA